jgi:N-acetylneuraminic acid mutarotase
VTAVIPNLGDGKGETDAAGRATFDFGDSGLYAVRARMIEETKGEHGGKAYDSIRRYSTVTFEVPARVTSASTASSAVLQLPALTPPVTSLGGAIAGDALYVYGGNLGSAHSYSNEGQSHELRRVALNGSGSWETAAEGPALQGLALVAHQGKLIRVGGFTAKNAEGEENDLWSQAAVAAFDPSSGEWSDLPELPEPRSSHDAAVLDGTLYVIGGWKLHGKDNREWHQTAWALDLTKADEWKALPAPPFERRALAVAAHDGRLFAIGGMQKEGGPCTKVSIFDPKSRTWSEGPSIQGEPMEGFGASAFATGGALYVSTSEGNLQRLSADGSAWEIVRELPTKRFFHRMLPLDDHRFVIVGGANMETGKFEEVDIVDVR